MNSSLFQNYFPINDSPFVALFCITLTSLILVITTATEEINITKENKATSMLPNIFSSNFNQNNSFFDNSIQQQPQQQTNLLFGGERKQKRKENINKKNKKTMKKH